MTNIIIILALFLPISGIGLYLFLQVKKAGRNESEIKHVKNTNEGLKDENEDLANRPRNLADRTKRLQQWRDKLPKNKD